MSLACETLLLRTADMGGLLGSCCVAPHMSPEISFTGVVLNIGTAGVCVWSGLGIIPFSVHPQLFGVCEASKRYPPPAFLKGCPEPQAKQICQSLNSQGGSWEFSLIANPVSCRHRCQHSDLRAVLPELPVWPDCVVSAAGQSLVDTHCMNFPILCVSNYVIRIRAQSWCSVLGMCFPKILGICIQTPEMSR